MFYGLLASSNSPSGRLRATERHSTGEWISWRVSWGFGKSTRIIEASNHSVDPGSGAPVSARHSDTSIKSSILGRADNFGTQGSQRSIGQSAAGLNSRGRKLAGRGRRSLTITANTMGVSTQVKPQVATRIWILASIHAKSIMEALVEVMVKALVEALWEAPVTDVSRWS